LKTAYWEYRTYKAELLPEVNFRATLPSYNKSYTAYQNDAGEYSYLRGDYMRMSGELSIDQNIWLTGGTLSLNTSLDYLKQYGDKRSQIELFITILLEMVCGI